MEIPTPGRGLVRIIPREVVVPAAGADAADLGVVEQDGLVHRAGVVVKAARDREVELEVLFRDAERGQVAHDGAQLVKAKVKRLVPAAVLLKEGKLVRARARAGNEAQDLVRLPARDAAGVGEQRAHLVRADLIELVDGAQHVARLLAQTEDGEKAVEHLAVIHADAEAVQAQARERVVDDGRDLGLVQNIERTVADDVDIRLIKLAEAAALCALAAPDLADLITAEREGELAVVGRDVLRQRHREVKTQGEIAVALREAVDLLFRLAAALGQQHLGRFDGGRVERVKP